MGSDVEVETEAVVVSDGVIVSEVVGEPVTSGVVGGVLDGSSDERYSVVKPNKQVSQHWPRTYFKTFTY